MYSVNKSSVKELFEALFELHRSTTKKANLSDLAKIYGTTRQNLDNWMNRETPERSKLFDFIEKARQDLGWDESKVYKKTVKAPRAKK